SQPLIAELLTKILQRLDPDVIDGLFRRIAFGSYLSGSEQLLQRMAQLMAPESVASNLEAILKKDHSYLEPNALSALAAVLSAEQFRMALRATIGSPRLQQLIPHLTDELVAEGFALARRTLTGWELAAAIKALADRMTPDLLREAARCASEIADIEDRSG